MKLGGAPQQRPPAAPAGGALALRALLGAAAVGLAAGLFFYYGRGFLPRHAVMVGVSVGILTLMTLRAAGRLARLWRR